MKITRSGFKRTFELIPDKNIVELAQQNVEDGPKAIILAKYGTLSLTTVLDFLRAWLEYGNFSEYNEVASPEGKRIITLMHNAGRKVSIYLSQRAELYV